MPIPSPGEPAPRFRAATTDGSVIDSDALAGGYTTLCFFGSAGHAAMAAMVSAIAAAEDMFDGSSRRFLGVSIDPDDRTAERLPPPSPGVQMIDDRDRALSQRFGAIEEDGDSTDAAIAYQPLTVLLDPNLRVLAVHRIDDAAEHPERLLGFLANLPAIAPARMAVPQAPVLLVPMVFEVAFCRQLIAHFDETGGQPSGILEDRNGQTVLTADPSRKRRQDLPVADDTLRQAAQMRIRRRLLPEIRKVFQFDATRMERSVVSRYAPGDFFAPHRDDSALGTAHRQFAITIPLNAEAFSGGLLRFPEYGLQHYPIPTGGALVHSCSLLHAVTPVAEGTRYAFIPVVFGEEAARLRETNTARLADGVNPDRRETLAAP